MDTGDVLGAMGGFLAGQMFAGQSQLKPAMIRFVSIRVEKETEVEFFGSLGEVIREVFLEVPKELNLDFEFTNKSELKIWGSQHNKRIGGQPLFTFALFGHSWTKKDHFFTLGLRAENGAPIELNIALFRHMLIKLDAKKVKYELW